MKPLSKINLGSPWPLGSTITKKGVNFSVAAPTARKLELLIFKTASDQEPIEIFELSSLNRSGDYWHIEIEGLKEGCCYGYRTYHKASFPGQSSYSQKVLLDPCARAIGGWEVYKRTAGLGKAGNMNCCLKGIVTERDHFDFDSHPRPRHLISNSIIYELHIGSFTSIKESGVSQNLRGTFIGLIDKIPYLKDLGITTIELLPTYIFDPFDSPHGKKNHWGYSPINWFTPHYEYVAGEDHLMARSQFRRMVEACHDADIEVLVDVVYNHTSEGNHDGPTLSWRGFADDVYYHKDKNGYYADVSGCGNSIAANRPLVQQLILESMRCWAIELGIDGFRFDLGIALSRGEGLVPLDNPPLFKAIEADPILSDLKLVSEPWDCGGLYRIGDFPSQRISTWNGCFRDDLRAFWKGDQNCAWRIKERLNGSQDLFQSNQNSICRSVNFITSHDGFTLHDLVSFNMKHNFSNGEQNRDGENHNINWNHGIEGPSSDKEIKALRSRQQRNLLTTLLLSPGIPMISMGDEVGRSQGGNNNSWCQDSVLSWMIWDKKDCDIFLLEFVKKLLIIRKKLPSIFTPSTPRKEKGLKSIDNLDTYLIQWHGVKLGKPDFCSWSHSLSFSLNKNSEEASMWMGLNACNKSLEFQIPEAFSQWMTLINTANPLPEGISTKHNHWKRNTINLKNHSVVVLLDNELIKTLYL